MGADLADQSLTPTASTAGWGPHSPGSSALAARSESVHLRLYTTQSDAHVRRQLLGTRPALSEHPTRAHPHAVTQGYAMGKKIVYSMTPERTSNKLTYGELAFAGFFSAVPTTFVAAPVERVKVLLQMQGQGGKQLYKGPLDAVAKLYAEGGLRSVFRGTGATIVRDGPGSAA